MTGVNNWRTALPWPEGLPRADDPEAIEYLYEDDEGKTHSDFHRENALAAMILAGAVFLNSNWWEEEWPEAARKTVALCVNTNDVFAWGCADAETMTHGEIEQVYRYWVQDRAWGTAVWAMVKTKQLPQKPVADRIRKDGIWDLAALAAEHGLRANHYDGVSGVLARRKRNAYVRWCEGTSRAPLPYDGGWWEGWKEYVAAHPGWQDDEWKAADAAARDEWRRANGYGGDE